MIMIMAMAMDTRMGMSTIINIVITIPPATSLVAMKLRKKSPIGTIQQLLV